MPTIRIGTFNCENLFARFKFNSNIDPAKAVKNGFDINMVNFEILNETEKKLTAKAIAELDADVLALQEVENLDVLKRFRGDRLKNLKYMSQENKNLNAIKEVASNSLEKNDLDKVSFFTIEDFIGVKG